MGSFCVVFMILFDSTNTPRIVYRRGRQKVSLLSLDCFTASRSEAQQGTSKGCVLLSEHDAPQR